ncbi:Uncharacterised protein [Mycobacteroides abscessus subsp. abscessus]|nr:Uncharacterised protein [Mycobacteroides abscessus subsp. abscessus]
MTLNLLLNASDSNSRSVKPTARASPANTPSGLISNRYGDGGVTMQVTM